MARRSAASRSRAGSTGCRPLADYRISACAVVFCRRSAVPIAEGELGRSVVTTFRPGALRRSRQATAAGAARRTAAGACARGGCATRGGVAASFPSPRLDAFLERDRGDDQAAMGRCNEAVSLAGVRMAPASRVRWTRSRKWNPTDAGRCRRVRTCPVNHRIYESSSLRVWDISMRRRRQYSRRGSGKPSASR